MNDKTTRKAYARERRAVLDAFAWGVIRGDLEIWRGDNSTFGNREYPDIELTAAEILDRAKVVADDYGLPIRGER